MSNVYVLNTNPLAFMRGQSGIVTMGEPYVANPTGTGWCTIENKERRVYDGTKPFMLDITMMGTNPKITVKPAAGKSPTRFLPYMENGCTYMKVDPTANAVFTSQLSGCNIYVATVGTDVWLFHANANDAKSESANTMQKRLRAVRAGLAIGATDFDLSLERGMHTYYQAGTAAGVFFGQKVVSVGTNSSGWGFYFYNALSQKVQRLGSSVAGTNATI